jgi:WD40 repeat protein
VLRTYSGHRSMVSGLAFRPDGESFVSTGRDRSLRLWWAGPEQFEDAAVASLAPPSER